MPYRGNSFNKNSKLFYGAGQENSASGAKDSGSNAGVIIGRPKDYSNFYQTKNKTISLTKETFGPLPGTTFNIITGAIVPKY